MVDRKLMLMGLDCAPPALVFDRMRGDLPNLESTRHSPASQAAITMKKSSGMHFQTHVVVSQDTAMLDI